MSEAGKNSKWTENVVSENAEDTDLAKIQRMKEYQDNLHDTNTGKTYLLTFNISVVTSSVCFV